MVAGRGGQRHRPPRLAKLAVVGYLNARPLVAGLAERFELEETVPAECWERLRSGAVDLGLIPSIGLGDDPELVAVPGIAIAAEGPVGSVILAAKGPLSALRSVAIDRSSRTSAALLKILFARLYEITPRFVAAAPDWQAMLAEHDAALLIGDPALALAEDEDLLERLRVTLVDLSAEWTRWIGLPFVFAVWAGRADRVTPEIVSELTRAHDRGLTQLESIARAAAQTPAHEEKNLRYLRNAIRYRMGPREAAGLRRYLELAGELGLLAGGRAAPAELRFASEAAAAPGASNGR